MNLNDPETGDTLWTIVMEHIVALPPTFIWLNAFYQFLVNDQRRLDAYKEALVKTVKGKTVVEIGPGAMLVMTLMCLEAGASKIYAIEVNEDAYDQAREFIEQRGLGDRVKLIPGSSLDVELPEKVDVCLSEVIGVIGSNEGAVPILINARRFLKPDGVMIPHRCITFLSPVFKPEIYQDEFISQFFESYSQYTGEKVVMPHRLPCFTISNFPEANIVKPPQIFEDLEFDGDELRTAFTKTLSFTVDKESRFDGLLLWIHLYTSPDTILDAFYGTSWNPLYISVDSFALEKGDCLEVCCQTELSSSAHYSFDLLIRRGSVVVYQQNRMITLNY